MKRFSTARRVVIVITFYQNGECATQAMRKLQTIFGKNEVSCESTIRRLVTKFETTGSVITVKSPGRKRSRRTEEQIVLMEDSVIASPQKSIRRRLQQWDIPTSSLHRILHKDFHMHACKIQLCAILSQLIMGGGVDLLILRSYPL